ncbi:MAG: nucleotidyltransferase domain-containing protein [Armatimonadota bacterium]
MLPQEILINRTREVCLEDDRVVAAMIHGSTAFGQNDKYSDIDLNVYLKDGALGTFDRVEWLNRIAPVIWSMQHEFGLFGVVFEGLIRADVNFRERSVMEQTISYTCSNAMFPVLESVLLVDKTGDLTRLLEPHIGERPSFRMTTEEVQSLVDHCIFWFHGGFDRMQRGEYTRAMDFLTQAQRCIAKTARILEGVMTDPWVHTKRVERDLSPKSYKKFVSCTSSVDPVSMKIAFFNAWSWTLEMIRELQKEWPVTVPEKLVSDLDALIVDFCG